MDEVTPEPLAIVDNPSERPALTDVLSDLFIFIVMDVTDFDIFFTMVDQRMVGGSEGSLHVVVLDSKIEAIHAGIICTYITNSILILVLTLNKEYGGLEILFFILR